MQLKLNKISVKPFVLIVSIIHVIAGFLLGAVMTLTSLVAPNEQGIAGVGPWSVLVFPILNGILGCMTAAFLASIYNFFAQRFGGIVFDFENV